MNKAYKVVRNSAGKLVVASEKASSKGKMKSCVLAVALAAFGGQSAIAGTSVENGVILTNNASTYTDYSTLVDQIFAQFPTEAKMYKYGMDDAATVKQNIADNKLTITDFVQEVYDRINSYNFGQDIYTKSNTLASMLKNTAFGDTAVVMGNGASSINGIAVGANSYSGDKSSTAVGTGAFASQGIALGADSKTLGGIAIGEGAKSDLYAYEKILFEDGGVSGEGTYSSSGQIAIGNRSYAGNGLAIAIGETTKAIGFQSTAIGTGAATPLAYGVALGASAEAAHQSTSVGTYSKADAYGVALGAYTKSSVASTAIGSQANAGGEHSVAVGMQAQATNKNALAIGSVGLAYGAKAGGEKAIALNGIAAANSSIAIGGFAQGQKAIAVGLSNIEGSQSIGIGDNNTAKQSNAIAIGNNVTVEGQNSIAVGTGHTVTGNNSGAFGDPNTVSGSESYAFGNNNTITSSGSFVLGNNANATQEYSVVLGDSSEDKPVTVVQNTVIGDKTTGDFAGAESIGVVSVGSSQGLTRQIVNVGAGEISATSTDAVNGSQLYQVSNTLASLVNSDTLGVKYDNETKDKVTLEGADGTLVTNIAKGAISADSTDAINGGQLFTEVQNITNEISRIDGVNSAQDATIAQNNTDSIKRDTQLQSNIDTTNATVAANDQASKDRDTQLQANITTVDNRVTSEVGRIDGVNSAQDATIAQNNTDSIKRDTQLQSNIDTTNATVAKGINFGGTTASNNYKLGDSIQVKGDNNISSTTVNGGVQLQINPNLSVNSITTGNTTIDTKGVTVTGGKNGTVALSRTGLDNGNNRIVNVADGVQRNDAVNVGQLNNAIGSVSQVFNDQQIKIDNLGYRVSKMEEGLNAGIAGAYAMSSTATAPLGKRGISFGTGYYGGENAVAIGYTQTSELKDNHAVAVKINGSFDSQNNVGAAIGATYFF